MFKTATRAVTVAATLALTAPAVLASGSDNTGADIRGQIVEKLTAQGYEVRKVKPEDGLYEAYARKDGKRMEIYLDSNLKIVGIKSKD